MHVASVISATVRRLSGALLVPAFMSALAPTLGGCAAVAEAEEVTREDTAVEAYAQSARVPTTYLVTRDESTCATPAPTCGGFFVRSLDGRRSGYVAGLDVVNLGLGEAARQELLSSGSIVVRGGIVIGSLNGIVIGSRPATSIVIGSRQGIVIGSLNNVIIKNGIVIGSRPGVAAQKPVGWQVFVVDQAWAGDAAVRATDDVFSLRQEYAGVSATSTKTGVRHFLPKLPDAPKSVLEALAQGDEVLASGPRCADARAPRITEFLTSVSGSCRVAAPADDRRLYDDCAYGVE